MPNEKANRFTRTIAITSGKGGVGKSNISANLAVALAERHRDVMLMDADLGLANVDVLLGLKPRGDIGQVMRGELSLRDIVLDGPSGIKVVPAASGIAELANMSHKEHAGLISSFSEFDDEVDVLLIDVAAGIGHSVIDFCKAVQEVVVVVRDEPTSLTDAYALIKVLSTQHGVRQFRLLANMSVDEAHGLELYQKVLRATDKYLDVRLSYMGAIPFDESMLKAVREQKPVIERFPKSRSAKAFHGLAAKVDGLATDVAMSGRLQFFVEQMARNGAQAASL